MEEVHSLWDRLQETEKPIFLYGTGNGADKILDVLDGLSVRITGVFASDGFVRSRTFRGFPVRSYSDVTSEYGDGIVILPAFGSALPEVRQFIERLDGRHELYLPEVPLYGGALFDEAYYAAHADVLREAKALFADEESKRLFDDAVRFRLGGKLRDLGRTEEPEKTLSLLFGNQSICTAVDGGAFRGDSTETIIRTLSPEKLFAVEADSKTYGKLSQYAEGRAQVVPVHAALWKEDGTLDYESSASRGSGEAGRSRRAKTETVPCRTLNSLLEEESVDFLKLDIEGAEGSALDGGEAVIRRDQPNLAVSVYHRTDDLFELPLRLHGLLPVHRLYLRRAPCIPLWDLTVYAVRTGRRAG